VASDPDRYLYVHSAEDILLQTLHWYRLGGGTSECSLAVAVVEWI